MENSKFKKGAKCYVVNPEYNIPEEKLFKIVDCYVEPCGIERCKITDSDDKITFKENMC